MTRCRGRPPSQRFSTTWRQERGPDFLVRKNMMPSCLGHHDPKRKLRDFNGKELAKYRTSWHYAQGLAKIPGPSVKDLRQESRRYCPKSGKRISMAVATFANLKQSGRSFACPGCQAAVQVSSEKTL